jgi:hypothetical protein
LPGQGKFTLNDFLPKSSYLMGHHFPRITGSDRWLPQSQARRFGVVQPQSEL